jgi:ABC-type thiamin/hydroxymethylpyrimidine transport system permease subunit
VVDGLLLVFGVWVLLAVVAALIVARFMRAGSADDD